MTELNITPTDYLSLGILQCLRSRSSSLVTDISRLRNGKNNNGGDDEDITQRSNVKTVARQLHRWCENCYKAVWRKQVQSGKAITGPPSSICLSKVYTYSLWVARTLSHSKIFKSFGPRCQEFTVWNTKRFQCGMSTVSGKLQPWATFSKPTFCAISPFKTGWHSFKRNHVKTECSRRTCWINEVLHVSLYC